MNEQMRSTSQAATRRTPPHEADAPLVTSRKGRFWVPGEVVSTAAGTVQKGPLFVEWEAPQNPSSPVPLILVHGGGGQGTDWMVTPDGRPGWATRFVEAGRIVYVVDRPGHGRSPYHPDVIGQMGGPFPYEAGEGLFSPAEISDKQTQWVFGHGPGVAAVNQFMAAMGPLPQDLAESQRMDADRLAQLLDLVGPSVLVTHSAGGPAGWLTAQARPDAVRGIIAVEPVGPPFGEIPGIGRLDWGLTAAPVAYEPECATARDAEDRFESDLAGLKVPAWEGIPVVLITGDASAFESFAADVVGFLNSAGTRAEHLPLRERGIRGNGHGLLFEANSDEIAALVLEEIDRITRG